MIMARINYYHRKWRPSSDHFAEKVFWNLDGEDLRICVQMNQSCKQILQKFFLGYVRLPNNANVVFVNLLIIVTIYTQTLI